MSKRTERIAMEIQRILADIFLRGVPDSRVTMISIINVDCSPDLRHATVTFVPMGGIGNGQKILEGLERLGSYLNKEVSKKLQIKYSPRLHFQLDAHFFENVDFINKLHQMEISPPEEEVNELENVENDNSNNIDASADIAESDSFDADEYDEEYDEEYDDEYEEEGSSEESSQG